MKDRLPRVLFFNINGSGMGHLSRCLAYARRMRGRARPIFFSLASAVEVIHEMGFEADYFVSHFSTASHMNAWNRELAVRFGLLLESVQPHMVVFDGTWPFHGFMDACDTWGVPRRVWSNRGLHKKDFEPVPVQASAFDLVVRPGEIGAGFAVRQAESPGRTIETPPVTLLDDSELLGRDEARRQLGLEPGRRYALLSLGPGNLKDVDALGIGLLDELRARDIDVLWARTPISVRDTELPRGVRSLALFPLVRFLRAFDLFAGAAGYNSCCEVLQAGIPSLLVPNTLVADDQVRRANRLTGIAPVVVSACEDAAERRAAVNRLLELADAPGDPAPVDLGGADRAVDEMLALVEGLPVNAAVAL